VSADCRLTVIESADCRTTKINYCNNYPYILKTLVGENHIVLLTEDGQIYTLGCSEQGRLGRVGELFVGRGGRRGLSLPLVPDIVHAKNRRVVFAGYHLITFASIYTFTKSYRLFTKSVSFMVV
jgi:hypothetical protein